MRSRTTILCCAIGACVLMPCGLARAETLDTPRSGRLYFGFADTSITPDRPVALGGQYHTRISSEVHDPLSATAMVIESSTAWSAPRVATCSCERAPRG